MSSNAKKRDQKILIKIAVALCYGVLSAMAINMFLSHANSYSAGLLGGFTAAAGFIFTKWSACQYESTGRGFERATVCVCLV